MRWPPDLTVPQLLVVLLAVLLASTLVVGGLTSQEPVSGYNAGWDGTADLRGMAAESGSLVVARDVDRYAAVQANETVAIVQSPRRAYTPSEMQAVREFVARGGTLVVAADFQPAGNALLAGLDSDVRLDGAPIRDERRYYQGPALPEATNVSASRYTDGVDAIVLNHGTSLHVGGAASPVVRTSPYAYADANRDGELTNDEQMDASPVVAVEPIGAGQLVVVADGSVFLNAMLSRPGNAQFAQNLFSQGSTHLLDYSHLGGIPLVPAVVLAIRDALAVQMALGLLAIAAVGLLVRRGDRDASTRVAQDDER